MRTTVLSLTMALALSGAAFAGDTMKHDHHAMTGESAVLGALTIEAPFARATLPNQPVAGGFMTITNAGETEDRLIAVASPSAGRMEIHEMKMDGDVMRMREISGGLVIPAGETVTLEPGGYHLMFMDLAGPFVAGETAEVVLTFEAAGEVALTFPIVSRAAAKNGHAHGGHGS